jgi:AbiJ N-terminal domain 4
MAIFDLYSKRRKAARGEVPDVYTYDQIPSGLRVQIVHIWGDAIGNPGLVEYSEHVKSAYQQMVEVLRREYQVFKLSNETYDPNNFKYAYNELSQSFLQEKNTERVLDVIELSARVIDRYTRSFDHLCRQNADQIADAAIKELNARFLEHGIGYEYSDGQIIRVDNQLTHAEIVKPVLQDINRNVSAFLDELGQVLSNDLSREIRV